MGTSARDKKVAIIGAGPAGLTAGYELAKRGIAATILEADPRYVGGISRTVEYKGFRFDIGGHRFFSKSQEVEDFWTEILGDDLLERPRSSRIYYRGKFFSYPLKPFEALRKLGLVEAALCVLSYLKARLRPIRPVRSFEDWVINQFGSRLFRIFFKTYTEKVWGMDCRRISADWAAQRIQGLSLFSALVNAFRPKPKARAGAIKTLIESFRYPRLGPGMMWETCARKFTRRGGELVMGARVVGLEYREPTRDWLVRYVLASDGHERELIATDVISSAPIRELARGLRPSLRPEAAAAANALAYRDFLTVALILKERNLFDDNWIYIHEPNVKVGRVQNFKSWSPELIPDPALACYGLEYFCNAGDDFWSREDRDLVALATRELLAIGLAASAEDVVDACVVRQPKAYPVYDDGYQARVELVRSELGERYPGLHLVGRNGMHKYNNQDHAMMTAMLTVRNIAEGSQRYDVWRVNQDAEYHESGAAGTGRALRQTPTAIREAS